MQTAYEQRISEPKIGLMNFFEHIFVLFNIKVHKGAAEMCTKKSESGQRQRPLEKVPCKANSSSMTDHDDTSDADK